MSGLICPVSTRTMDKNAARMGATLTALLLVGYGLTGMWPVLLLVVADYLIRCLTPWRSPIGWLASRTAAAFRLPSRPMNEGPKIFAWRLGMLMAVAALMLMPVSPTASVAVSLALAALNAFDGLGNLCLGCVIYTYVVLPFFSRPRARSI